MTEDRLASDANQIDHDCLAAFSSILAQHKGTFVLRSLHNVKHPINAILTNNRGTVADMGYNYLDGALVLMFCKLNTAQAM
eukprot:scaffold9760_cov117-Alexandrium_tamarense.AAC.11